MCSIRVFLIDPYYGPLEWFMISFLTNIEFSSWIFGTSFTAHQKALLHISCIIGTLDLLDHGWGNYPGKSGHGLTNFLTLYISFEHKHYQAILLILQSCMRPDY